jgi:hypothetical protein
MLTVLIKRSNEPQVVQLTQDNLSREHYPPGAQVLVVDSWWQGVNSVENQYVCLVESDCLVSSGYFSSMMGLFQKNPYFRKLAMLSSAVGLNNWANRIYGYHLGETSEDGIIPSEAKHSTDPYPLQIGYAPGAIIRTNSLVRVPASVKNQSDLVKLSTALSLYFWNTGQRVYVNPNTTYVTTEDYVGQLGRFHPHPSYKVLNMFKHELIT